MTTEAALVLVCLLADLLVLAGLAVNLMVLVRVMGILRSALRPPLPTVDAHLDLPQSVQKPVNPPKLTEPLKTSKPLPLDHRLPPKVFVYQPRSGQQAPICDCHQRPIEPGEQVVLWPVPCGMDEEPGSKGYWIRCQENGIKG